MEPLKPGLVCLVNPWESRLDKLVKGVPESLRKYLHQCHNGCLTQTCRRLVFLRSLVYPCCKARSILQYLQRRAQGLSDADLGIPLELGIQVASPLRTLVGIVGGTSDVRVYHCVKWPTACPESNEENKRLLGSILGRGEIIASYSQDVSLVARVRLIWFLVFKKKNPQFAAWHIRRLTIVLGSLIDGFRADCLLIAVLTPEAKRVAAVLHFMQREEVRLAILTAIELCQEDEDGHCTDDTALKSDPSFSLVQLPSVSLVISSRWTFIRL